MDTDPFYKFSENTKIFLKNLEEFTNHKIYYFGSSRRFDYIQGCDIDIAMFTDNTASLITQIIGFLNTSNEFKQIVHTQNNILVNGYKLIYKNNNIDIELVVYDNKFKSIMLDFYEKSANMPLILSITLLILKYMNRLNILSGRAYYKIKVFLINNLTYSNKLVVLN
jgi:hypothetical protein